MLVPIVLATVTSVAWLGNAGKGVDIMGISGITSGLGRYAGSVGSMLAERARRAASTSPTDSTATQNDDGDTLEISPEAEALAGSTGSTLLGAANSLFGDAGADGTITLNELETLQQEAMSSVKGRLAFVFAKNKIDTSKEIRLQVGSDGGIVVANDHPQKAEIEKLVNGDEQLRNDYVRMTSLTETVGSIKEAAAFQAAYAKDPYAAVAQYSHLFNQTRKGSVTMSILGDQYTSLYTSPSGRQTAIGA